MLGGVLDAARPSRRCRPVPSGPLAGLLVLLQACLVAGQPPLLTHSAPHAHPLTPVQLVNNGNVRIAKLGGGQEEGQFTLTLLDRVLPHKKVTDYRALGGAAAQQQQEQQVGLLWMGLVGARVSWRGALPAGTACMSSASQQVQPPRF